MTSLLSTPRDPTGSPDPAGGAAPSRSPFPGSRDATGFRDADGRPRPINALLAYHVTVGQPEGRLHGETAVCPGPPTLAVRIRYEARFYHPSADLQRRFPPRAPLSRE